MTETLLRQQRLLHAYQYEMLNSCSIDDECQLTQRDAETSLWVW